MTERTVAARCPICRVILPLFTVVIERHGFLGRHIRLTLDGDATDYVAHIWQHQEGGRSWD